MKDHNSVKLLFIGNIKEIKCISVIAGEAVDNIASTILIAKVKTKITCKYPPEYSIIVL